MSIDPGEGHGKVYSILINFTLNLIYFPPKNQLFLKRERREGEQILRRLVVKIIILVFV